MEEFFEKALAKEKKPNMFMQRAPVFDKRSKHTGFYIRHAPIRLKGKFSQSIKAGVSGSHTIASTTTNAIKKIPKIIPVIKDLTSSPIQKKSIYEKERK